MVSAVLIHLSAFPHTQAQRLHVLPGASLLRWSSPSNCSPFYCLLPIVSCLPLCVGVLHRRFTYVPVLQWPFGIRSLLPYSVDPSGLSLRVALMHDAESVLLGVTELAEDLRECPLLGVSIGRVAGVLRSIYLCTYKRAFFIGVPFRLAPSDVSPHTCAVRRSTPLPPPAYPDSALWAVCLSDF
jgi:hypothetical protein